MKNKVVLAIIKCIARFPLGILYLISDIMFVFLMFIIRYRRRVVRKHLTESFPEKSINEIKRIERKFYLFLSDQIVETIKLFHISDKEMRRRVVVKNYELINSVNERGHSAVLMLGHYGNWEWVQEISCYFTHGYMASIYHPLSNIFWDNTFIELRSRWGAHIIPMKSAPRKLLDKRNMPWVCGFIADQFTRNKHDDNHIEFLHHKTWFIYGPEEIGNKVGAEFFYLEMQRPRRGHYVITFTSLKPSDISQPFPVTRQFWKEFEKTIEKEPAYWLWSHKRWK